MLRRTEPPDSRAPNPRPTHPTALTPTGPPDSADPNGATRQRAARRATRQRAARRATRQRAAQPPPTDATDSAQPNRRDRRTAGDRAPAPPTGCCPSPTLGQRCPQPLEGRQPRGMDLGPGQLTAGLAAVGAVVQPT